MDITQKLINWYLQNRRNLPWRNTSDPYKIWLSEVILQQTRVNQGLEYYLKFTQKFPNLKSLADASEDEILKLWQGLGYYSRARNMHKAAKTICETNNGKFPENFDQILKLPGIGNYTAAAISSIAFGQPTPVIDGNVQRVISRLFAIQETITSKAGLNHVKEALNLLIDKNLPGVFNQAMMEFGAVFCKPRNPDCSSCIFKDKCLAFSKNIVNDLPVKEKKPEPKTRYFYYLEIAYPEGNNRFVYLKKRTENDIWKGLYDFPLIETTVDLAVDNLIDHPFWSELFSTSTPVIKKVSGKYTHILTHQKIIARFIESEITAPLITEKFVAVKSELIDKYPVPRLIEKYFQHKNHK